MFARRLALFLSSALFAATLSAQTLSWEQPGLYADGAFGTRVAILGDVDGDGRDDVLVGDTNASPIGFLDGQILVYSGQTGLPIHTINPVVVFQGLGFDVDCAGDVDADGVPDIAATSASGNPEIYSGATGLLMHAMTYLPGAVSGRIAGLGDVNGDGFDDVAVSDSTATVNGNATAGRVDLVSGNYMANGVGPIFLQSWSGAAGDLLGNCIDSIDDLDGDSVRDLIVTSPGESGAVGIFVYNGVIRVYSGATGVEIRKTRWFGPAGEFAHEVASAGDLDRDGYSEIVVGNPFDDSNGAYCGRVRVYSGIDGTSMYTILGDDAGDTLGWSVSAGGDVDADGHPDLLLGARGDEGTDGIPGGAIWIISGQDGSVQSIVDIEEGSLGSAVAGPADFDGDLYGDLAVGASGVNISGKVYGLLGECLGNISSYCSPAAPNSFSTNGGTITASGSTSVIDQDLILLARQCPPSVAGIFFYGTNQTQVSVGDGALCTTASIQRIYPVQIVSALGTANLELDWNAAPIGSGPNMILAGETKNFSFWFRDPAGGPVGFNYTNAVSVSFCP